jgi:hypothetical protein
MPRRPGYLANFLNVPPLLFRFQYNPDLLEEKKTYTYESETAGEWGFEQTGAESGFGKVGGFLGDLKDIGALLMNVKPLKPTEGGDRIFSLEFKLASDAPGPFDGDSHYGGSIEPDLALLRSFMNPSYDVIDVGKMIAGGADAIPCFNRPPEVDLVYGSVSTTCVMTSLTIKVTDFNDDATARRATVSVKLKQQPYAYSPLIETVTRLVNVARSYDRKGIGRDLVNLMPVAGGIFYALDEREVEEGRDEPPEDAEEDSGEDGEDGEDGG